MATVAAPASLQDSPVARSRAIAPCLLVLWSGFLFFYGLNVGDLYRNEGLRARIAQEMYASGDWVVPTLYDQPIFTKPPLMYWAICLVSWPFGVVTTATARLPSGLAGLATVVIFFWYFRRCLGTRAGYLAALFVPLSIFWLEKVPAAEIDALQVAWVAGSLLFFLRALEEEEVAIPQLRWWLLAALCLAGGTLAKWTAPAFFYGTIIPLLWWRGRLKLFFRWRHLLALGVALGLVGGWIALAIWRTSGGEFWDAVLREAAPRLLPGENPKPYPWLETLLHPAIVLLAALPASLAILWPRSLARAAGSDDGPAVRLRQALHCWLWPSLLFWTIHPDHTLRNRAPLFPAIAGLAVFAFLAWERRPLLRLGRPVNWLTAFLIVWTALKVVHVEVVLPRRTQDRQTSANAACLAAFLPADVIVFLFRLKDECLLFYLGQPAQRLAGPESLPVSDRVFCILTDEEWRDWTGVRAGRVVASAKDGQGEPIHLVLVSTN